MDALQESVEIFFTSYAAAFNHSDMVAIERHYALPALLVHEKGQSAFEKPAQLRQKLKEVLRYYRDLRFRSCHFEIQSILPAADERIACIAVRWTVVREAPLPEMRFQTTYHIRRQNAVEGVEWAIVAVLSLEEPGLS